MWFCLLKITPYVHLNHLPRSGDGLINNLRDMLALSASPLHKQCPWNSARIKHNAVQAAY